MSVKKDFFENPLAEYEAFNTYNSLGVQIDRIKDINNRKSDIDSKISDYESLHADLSGNEFYQDFNKMITKDGSERIWLDYIDKKSSAKDAAKEDIHSMIIQQNNAYIIGMITLATVLVTTYMTFK